MENYQNIGNPVDTWWNHTRQVIDPCIDMLAQFPPTANSQTASHMIAVVRQARQTIAEGAVPHKATKIRKMLIECLNQLEVSLREQVVHGILAKPTSHRMAYRYFMTLSHHLLQRGIYEPDPTQYVRQNTR